jgi:hypothetical protein
MWSLIISTFAFFIAIWYIRRYMDEQEIPKGFTRGILALTLASLVSWGAGAVANWAHETLEGPQPTAQTSDEDISQLLKAAGQTQP